MPCGLKGVAGTRPNDGSRFNERRKSSYYLPRLSGCGATNRARDLCKGFASEIDLGF